MRIVSWNVNGLRKLRPLEKLFNILNADIICLQETRISGTSDPDLESLAFVPGYDSFFSICKLRGGYSGVATFCKNGVATPVDAGEGFCGDTGCAIIESPEVSTICECADDDCNCRLTTYTAESLALVKSEGRCVITDHRQFVLINIYAPAVSVEGRDVFKMQFLSSLRAKIDALQRKRRKVVVVGDFNICPTVIDSAEPVPRAQQRQWEQRPTRVWFRNLLMPSGPNMVDSFREMHPRATRAYSCWSEATRARENNHGVRIDLIVMDRDLYSSSVLEAEVMASVQGSDHCPVAVVMRNSDEALLGVPKEPPPFCSRFMPRFALRQKSLKEMFKPQVVSSNTRSGSPFDSMRLSKSRQVFKDVRTKGRLNGAKKRQHRGVPQTQSKIANFFTPKDQMLRAYPSVSATQTSTEQNPQPKGTGGKNTSSSGGATASGMDESTLQFGGNGASRLIKSQESTKAWRKLLSGPPPPPLCRHGNPSVLKSVGKSGENRGRTFFSCAFPVGIGKNADCGFFKWAPFKAGTRTLPK